MRLGAAKSFQARPEAGSGNDAGDSAAHTRLAAGGPATCHAAAGFAGSSDFTANAGTVAVGSARSSANEKTVAAAVIQPQYQRCWGRGQKTDR